MVARGGGDPAARARPVLAGEVGNPVVWGPRRRSGSDSGTFAASKGDTRGNGERGGVICTAGDSTVWRRGAGRTPTRNSGGKT
ncbi:hypothetical protein GCM10009548_15770 [Streptomyces malaysiensis subsp. malaysiensis]